MADVVLKFTEQYDHRFTDRNAMQKFPQGYEGAVPEVVARAAIAAGKAAPVGGDLKGTAAELEAIATGEGVDVAAIEGTGPRGMVTKNDLTTAILSKRAGNE